MAKAFTVIGKSQDRELKSGCQVASAIETAAAEQAGPDHLRKPRFFHAKAIWDTGATHSVISKRLADHLELEATGTKRVVNANATYFCDSCLVSIVLSDGIFFTPLPITIQTLQEGYDVLIGMDIIGKGDFAVSRREGNLVFSFREPSADCIDFTERLA